MGEATREKVTRLTKMGEMCEMGTYFSSATAGRGFEIHFVDRGISLRRN